MLFERILELKQNTSSITSNPTLDAIETDECKWLDSLYNKDEFIKAKIESCLSILKNVNIDYIPQYKSVYEEYNEAITYCNLLNKKIEVEHIPESVTSTPDFHVKKLGEFGYDLFIEVKSFSFLNGNLNYKDAQQDALTAKIEIERQLKAGKNIASAISIVSPFQKNGRTPEYHELIDIYLDKIFQNLKKDQFAMGDTILLVDLKQLSPPNKWFDNAIAIYQEKMYQSMVSGILWNVAFGKQGNNIYAPIEFEGKRNIINQLERNGLLIEIPYIKGLIFVTYDNFKERKYIGFYRSNDFESQVFSFLLEFCDFVNDENNSMAFKILQQP